MDSPSPTSMNEGGATAAPEEKSVPVSSQRATPTKDEAAEAARLIHELLARQLEYYFSTTNLAKDTYVSTLRSLNDGYVPISIIANFGKVQALVPHQEMSVEAVRTAASDFSELLEVVEVDAKTGKRVVVDEDPTKKTATTVPAVGPVSGEPIPMSLIGSMSSQPGTPAHEKTPDTPGVSKTVSSVALPASSIQNTVIVREAPEGTEEDTIREIFAFEACPVILSVHLDLQNCWFVTLDTSSREAMFNVMFTLRTMKFPSGEPVKARLKSSAAAAAASLSPSPVAVSTLSAFYNHEQVATMFVPTLLPQSGTNQGSTTSTGGKKKRGSNKNRANGGSNRSKNQGQQQQQPSSSHSGGINSNSNSNSKFQKSNGHNQKRHGSKEGTRQTNSPSTSPKTTPNTVSDVRPEPPAMNEEAFPSLPPSEDSFGAGNINKIEVEKVPDQRSDMDEDELFEKARGNAFSDSSSTATASTSSTPSSMMQPTVIMGGYAAALMRTAAPSVAPPLKTQKKPTSVVVKRDESKTNVKANSETKKQDRSSAGAGTPPAWGNGRSFADVLRPGQAV